MIAEFDVAGVFFPIALVTAVMGFVLTLVIRRVLAICGFYRLVWHPGLFDAALFILMWGVFATCFLPSLRLVR